MPHHHQSNHTQERIAEAYKEMCEAYDRISHDYDILVQDHTKITQEYEKIIADSNKFDKSEVLGLLREIGVKWTEVVKILEEQEKKRKETMEKLYWEVNELFEIIENVKREYGYKACITNCQINRMLGEVETITDHIGKMRSKATEMHNESMSMLVQFRKMAAKMMKKVIENSEETE